MRRALTIFILSFTSFAVKAQEKTSLKDRIFTMPDKFFGAVDEKTSRFNKQLEKATLKYLDKLQKQELKMRKQLAKKDSAAAAQLFGDTEKKYADLKNKLNGSSDNLQKVYSSSIDSMKTSLSFLHKNELLNNGQLQSVLGKYGSVQDKFNQTEFISQQLKEREQLLKEKLQQFGLAKEFNRFRAKVYYYRAQADEYKRIFESPQKLESVLLSAVSKVPAFSSFFSQHSDLSSMFILPGNDNISPAAMNEMQTREMLMQELGGRMGGPNAQQNINSSIAGGQSALQPLKDKLIKAGSNAGADMPENFRPNTEKTKSFLNRIEFGTNMQSQKSNYFFPTTTDLGLSIGYKLNAKSVIGIGTSYKIGWGKDVQHIRVTGEGSSIRSFLDWKLKGSFYATGGYEYNYQTTWTNSALIGISKIINVNNKYFKKTKAQLLWDFLSYRQLPVTPALKFRIGYTLK